MSRLCSLPKALLLTTGLLLASGCGDSSNKAKQVAAAQEDPQGEFEWGIERLKRALRLFRPSSVDGLKVTERKLESQLFPPDEENATYTARVTISTETAFLHGKREIKKKAPETKPDQVPEIDDPLADPSEKLNRLIEIPGAGPQAPAIAPVDIEPRSVDRETVFELTYVAGRWKLKQPPELKHEQLWFEYAFE